MTGGVAAPSGVVSSADNESPLHRAQHHTDIGFGVNVEQQITQLHVA
jgi:hypothetical protein